MSIAQTIAPGRDRHLRGKLHLLAVLAVVGLAGCREDMRLEDGVAVRLNQPEYRHPIKFDERQELLYLELPHMGAALSSRQELDVAEFLQRYRRQGGGPLRVSTPSSPRAHMAAQRSVAAIEDLVWQSGIDPQRLRRARHPAHAKYGEMIQIAFRRPVAVAPQCGDWSADVGVDRERIPYENFGCATQRNLAKMVANSRDLVEPQPETPRASERRSVQWADYTGGDGSAGKEGGGGAAATPVVK